MGPATAETEWYISAGMVFHVGDAVTVTAASSPIGPVTTTIGRALASFGVVGVLGNRPTGRF
ncbi:hypothetical protein KRMM14A1004_25950 [Krasilnikovia sp. MM14-A1004]